MVVDVTKSVFGVAGKRFYLTSSGVIRNKYEEIRRPIPILIDLDSI